MSPDAYCEKKASASGSSFYYAFLFLPAARRRAITALYAFCREVDDVVDECSDVDVARSKLAWWRTEVDRMYEGHPQHPVTRALAPAVQRFRLKAAHLLELIDGMEMDLVPARIHDYAALERYCYLVAGTVGLLAAEIFGYRDTRTLDYARRLGTAFQLTNIIRDVGEDAHRGRIYLPQEDLHRFGVAERDILLAQPNEAFVQMMRFQAARARAVYATARESLPHCDQRTQRPGLIMAAIYRSLLDEIEADGFRVLTHRTSIPPLRKLWIACLTWFRP